MAAGFLFVASSMTETCSADETENKRQRVSQLASSGHYGQNDQQKMGDDLSGLFTLLHAEEDPWIQTTSLALLSSDTVEESDSQSIFAQPGALPPFLSYDATDSWLEIEEDDTLEPVPDNSEANLNAPKRKGNGYDTSPLRYRVMWQPSQNVQGQSTQFGLVEQDVNVIVPIWITDPSSLALFGSIRSDAINTGAVFPQSGQQFPSMLWNIRGGVNYKRVYSNGWVGGANLNVGSGSDVPFGESRDVNFGGFVFVRIPHGEQNAWNFSLVYSPLSQIPYPVPLVAYEWKPSDTFSANLGLPLQLTYKPTTQWTFDFSYILMTTVHAQATYQLHENFRVYSGFDWQNQSWYLHDREISKERLFQYDKRFNISLQTARWKYVTFDVSTGYLFDRFYFIGQNYSDRDQDRINIGSGVFASAQAWLVW